MMIDFIFYLSSKKGYKDNADNIAQKENLT